MSAIGGIVSRAAELSPRQIEGVTAGLRWLRPGPVHRRVYDGACLVHLPYEARPEPQLRQPYQLQDGALLSWGGRLDYVDELAAELGLRSPAPSAGEVELVAAAFDRWGNDAPSRLLGDWALAVVHPERRSILLARDSIGVRPLFFARREGSIAWGSTIAAVGLALGLDWTVDERFVGDYLTCNRAVYRGWSPYREVRSVRPGTTLRISPDGIEETRWWRPEEIEPWEDGDDAEYEERFREVLTAAVATRLRDTDHVFSELSGGLDSSSIVCIADALIRRGDVRSELSTVSYVFEQSSTSDERPYISEVLSQIDASACFVGEREQDLLAEVPAELFLEYPVPELLFWKRTEAVGHLLAERQARLLLNGTGGDQLLLSQLVGPFDLADLVSRGRPLEVIPRLAAWARSSRRPYLRLIREGLLAPLAGERLRELLRDEERPLLEPVLEPAFFARLSASGVHRRPYRNGCRRPSRREQLFLLEQAAPDVTWPLPLPVPYFLRSYPLLDRKVVELGLALPMEQKLTPGETRSIMRRALRDVLPPVIAQRRSKAGPDRAFLTALARSTYLERIEREPRVAEFGYLSAATLSRLLEEARHGLVSSTPVLARILSLEIWLRSLDNWPSAIPSSRLPEAEPPAGVGAASRPAADHVVSLSTTH